MYFCFFRTLQFAVKCERLYWCEFVHCHRICLVIYKSYKYISYFLEGNKLSKMIIQNLFQNYVHATGAIWYLYCYGNILDKFQFIFTYKLFLKQKSFYGKNNNSAVLTVILLTSLHSNWYIVINFFEFSIGWYSSKINFMRSFDSFLSLIILNFLFLRNNGRKNW